MRGPTSKPEKSVRKQGKFAPGHSGNPAGKPKGTRHRVTLAVEALMEGEAEALTRKAIQLAKKGDLPALRLCLDRISPARRDRPVAIELPSVASVSDHPRALAAILAAVVDGELTPSEAQALSAVLAEHRKAVETIDMEARLAALENAGGTNG